MNTAHPGDDVLVAYALDETDPGLRSRIEAHLEVCEACRGVASRLRTALAAYREAEPREAPAGVLADLLEAQAAQRTRWSVPGWSPRPALVAAALIVLAGLFSSGFWMGRSTAPAPPAPAPAVEIRGDEVSPPRPLPQRPAIEFRSEPPLETRYALVAETTRAGIRATRATRGRRDSL